MVDESLLNYILTALRNGQTPDEIRKDLLSEGKFPQEVDAAIQQAYQQRYAPPNPQQQPGQGELQQAGQGAQQQPSFHDVKDLGLTFHSRQEMKDKIKDRIDVMDRVPGQESQKAQQPAQQGPAPPQTPPKKPMYDKASRPPQHVMRQSMHNLSNRLNRHNKILIIGFVFLLVVVLGLVGTLYYMFLEFRENYNAEQTEPQINPGSACGYCEYFTHGYCEKYMCCANVDCDDGNPDTIDRCIFPSTMDSRCTYTPLGNIIPTEKKDSSEEDGQQQQPSQQQPQQPADQQQTVELNSSKSGQACETDADCDDELAATKDMCLGSPDKVCLNLPILSCIPDDGYCPPSCTSATDSDCTT